MGKQATRSTARRVAASLVVAVMVGVLVSSCSSRPSADTTASQNAVAPQGRSGLSSGGVGAPAAGGADAGTAQGASFNVNALDAPPQDTGQAFVSSATMTVKTDDVSASKVKAIELTATDGGGLFGEQTTFGAEAKATLTLKVPPPKFEPLMSDLGRLGSLESEEVKTEDVTQQVIDLDARIKAAQSSLDRSQLLLDGAKSLTEIVAGENEVAKRQAEVESLRGQQQTLAKKVDLATIVLTLTSTKPTPAVEQAHTPEPPKPLPGFGDGLGGGLEVARNVGTVALAVFGALLPFLPLLVIVFFGVRWLRRRMHRGASSGAAAATAGGPPPPGGIS